MKLRIHVRVLLESSGFVGGLVILSRLWFDDPCFQSFGGWPFFLVPVVFSAMYGLPGSLGSVLSVSVAVAIEALLNASVEPVRLAGGAVACLWSTGVVLYLRSVLVGQAQALRSRFRELVKRNHRLTKENRAMEELCQQLEVRISMDRRSLTTVLTRLNGLDRGDLGSALQELLEICFVTIGVEKASIWKYERGATTLVLEASKGWPAAQPPRQALSSEGSVPGWVCRNGQAFSLRMMLDQPQFGNLDRSQSLMAYPIRVGDRVWGVLNVEDLPFVKYSKHAEALLEVILKLANRSLKTLVDRETLFAQQETNPETELPGVSILMRALEQSFRRSVTQQSTFSFVLVELTNASDFLGQGGRSGVSQVLADLATLIQAEVVDHSGVYHYMQENQLAFLLPDRDLDGTAVFCLELLGSIQGRTWPGSGQGLVPEVLFGYGIFRPGMTDTQSMVNQAEQLLAMQRLP